MSENKVPIKTLNGHALSDEAAREAAKRNAEEVARLSEEIGKALLLDEGIQTVVVISDNLLNPATLEIGGYYSWDTGRWVERADIASSGFIPCKSGDVFVNSQYHMILGGNVTFYDEQKKFISGINVVDTPYTIPDNNSIRYFRTSMYADIAQYKGQINKDEKKAYDDYAEKIIDSSAYNAQHDVNAPNIAAMKEEIKNIGAANRLYFMQSYENDVTIVHKRSVSCGTSYWTFIVNNVRFDGTSIKPSVVGTDESNPLGGAGIKNVTGFVAGGEYLHVINGGIYLAESNEADGITIIDGNILRGEGVEQFAVEQYVLGIDANGNFKTYRNVSAADILADGCMHAVTGFVPLIENGEVVPDSTLSICPHYNVQHPRQIIGRLADGKYFTFACDGRADGEKGMTLEKCIDTIMADLDVEFAYNLDGGGSAQSAVGKKLVNRILDNRKIPNVIVFG